MDIPNPNPDQAQNEVQNEAQQVIIFNDNIII